MNTADLCAEGRELYAEYMALKFCTIGVNLLLRRQRAEMDAYRRYQEHVRGCPICSRKDDEE